MERITALLSRWGRQGNSSPWWRSEIFWLAFAALIMPGGSLLLLLPLARMIRDKMQPARVRVRVRDITHR